MKQERKKERERERERKDEREREIRVILDSRKNCQKTYFKP